MNYLCSMNMNNEYQCQPFPMPGPPPCQCLCTPDTPSEKKKSRKRRKPGKYVPPVTPPDRKAPVYEPCVHRHFKEEPIDRECLTHDQYLDLLATPKGYRWMGEADCSNPELEDRSRKSKKKKKTKRKPSDSDMCQVVNPEAGGDFADEFVESMWDVMSPEITCRLIDFLVNEFGMSIEEAEDYIDCKCCMGKQSPCKRKKSKAAIGFGPKYKWVKEFSDIFAKRIEQYIVAMLMTRRTPRVKRIAEKILETLCNLTGEKTTLQNPKTKIQKVMVLIADRLALWIEDLLKDIDKPLRKRPSTAEETEEEEEEEPEPEDEAAEEEKEAEKKGKAKEEKEKPKEEKKQEEAAEEEGEEEAEEKPQEEEKQPEAQEKEPEPKEQAPADEPPEEKPAQEEPAKEPEPEPQPEPEPAAAEPPPREEPQAEEEAPPPQEEPPQEEEAPPAPVEEKVDEGPPPEEPAPAEEQPPEEAAEEAPPAEEGEGEEEAEKEPEVEVAQEAVEEEAPPEEPVVEEAPVEEEEVPKEEEKKPRDILDLVKEDIAGIPKDRRTERQKLVKGVVDKRVRKMLDGTDMDWTSEELDDAASRAAHWTEYLLGAAEPKAAAGKAQSPGKAFTVQPKTGSTLEIQKLSSFTVAQETAKARGVEPPPRVRKIPETVSPMDVRSAQEWVDWASNIANVADEWGKWIDSTLTDAEKKMAERKKEGASTDWKQWRDNTQTEAQKWRVEREKIKDEGKLWETKLEKRPEDETEKEVRTTDMS